MVVEGVVEDVGGHHVAPGILDAHLHLAAVGTLRYHAVDGLAVGSDDLGLATADADMNLRGVGAEIAAGDVELGSDGTFFG